MKSKVIDRENAPRLLGTMGLIGFVSLSLVVVAMTRSAVQGMDATEATLPAPVFPLALLGLLLATLGILTWSRLRQAE